MTVVEERPVTKDKMTRLFEELELPDIKMELLRGEIVMMAGPDWVHNDIIESVVDQIPRAQWQRKQTQDVAIPGETSEPQPDLVVLEHEAFRGPGRLIPAPAVALLLEVVSKNSVDRDYRVKRSMYAVGKVPAYLIIDPLKAQCVLLTEPTGAGEEADYKVERISKFGEPVPIDMLGLSLETEDFPTLR
jgi:Uma2 family endonuclease